MTENEISNKIIGAAIEVHKQLGPGLLENNYETCLAYDLKLKDLKLGLLIKFNSVKVIDGVKRILNGYL